MRFRLLSDLHLEFSSLDLEPAGEDAVLLAGDIHVGTAGLEWARRTFERLPVFYTPGNHEYYGSDWMELPGLMRERAAQLGIDYLDAGEGRCGDVRLLGCTLWTDFDYFGAERRQASMQACQVLFDYRKIRSGPGLLVTEQTRQRHHHERAWLSAALQAPAPAGIRKTLVMTHMLPSDRSTAVRYKPVPTTAGFTSHLDGLFDAADVWVHGHTHDSFDYQAGRCRVVCNPRGYCLRDRSLENPAFQSALLIEV